MARYLGQYEILKELGAGHFGTVYQADGEVPGRGVSGPRRRLVAIKKLKNPADPVAKETLQREFELLDQVKHRSLCRVYEYLDDDGAVVMEYVHGVTLRQVLDLCKQKRERVFVEAAIEIGCEVADCLYQSFSTPGRGGDPLQLVHRDLKPENIMITPEGEVKVLDFGLAKVSLAHRKDGKRVKGTPLYMAPEQAIGQLVDHRTDLFALGLVLYELLMERPAYDLADNATQAQADAVMKRIEKADLAKELRDIESRLPGPGPVVTRCLQANPRARYENGHELMLDLRRQLLKERGAYLREFCQYFFETVQRLEPLPSLGEPGAIGKSKSAARSAPTEPTRAEPMSSSQPPRPGGPPGPGGPPRPGGPPGPPRPAAGPPRPAGPPGMPSAAPPAAPPAGRAMAAPSSAKPMGRSGSNDGLSDAPMQAKKKKDGVLRPDATGMLKMEELREEFEDDEDDLQKPAHSATQFFAIPAGKKKSGDFPAPPPPAAQLGTSAGRALPGQSSANLAPLPGPVGGGMISGPIASGPIASGPIASGPGGYPNAPPSHYGQGGPAAIPDAEERSSSGRVYAIVLALFAIVICSGVSALGGLLLWTQMDKDEVVADNDPPPRGADPVVSDDPDTGGDEVLPVETVTPIKKPKTPKQPKVDGGTPAEVKPPPEPKKPPPAAKATITVKIPSDFPATGAVVKCGEMSKKGSFSGGVASIPDIPTSEDCTLLFKGGPPAQFRPVRGGQSLNCTFVGTTASCK